MGIQYRLGNTKWERDGKMENWYLVGIELVLQDIKVLESWCTIMCI